MNNIFFCLVIEFYLSVIAIDYIIYVKRIWGSSCVVSSFRTEVIIYVVERSPNGTSKRIPATTLFGYLEQANIKAQLAQIGVSMSVTRTELSPAQLKQLLQNAPAGKYIRTHASDINTRHIKGSSE